MFGPLSGWCVTAVPCGHSRSPECWGKRLARVVARRIGAPFIQIFADRPVAGTSHPKEFAKLPPLKQIDSAFDRVLVVDDVATSGWHIEEILTALRLTGSSAVAVAWISGTIADGDVERAIDRECRLPRVADVMKGLPRATDIARRLGAA